MFPSHDHRGEEKLVKAGIAVTGSAIRTAVRRVSKEVAFQNQKTCQDCPHGMFKVLGKKKIPHCGACGCTGSGLSNKWRDPRGHCPLTIKGLRCDQFGDFSPDDPNDPPVWDNRKKESEFNVPNRRDQDSVGKK